jgi:hypothetical protein
MPILTDTTTEVLSELLFDRRDGELIASLINTRYFTAQAAVGLRFMVNADGQDWYLLVSQDGPHTRQTRVLLSTAIECATAGLRLGRNTATPSPVTDCAWYPGSERHQATTGQVHNG